MLGKLDAAAAGGALRAGRKPARGRLARQPRNTEDITRFIARESRSYVVSVSGMMHADWIPGDVPHADLIRDAADGWLADGGSCVAGPDGQWVLEPQVGRRGALVVEAISRRLRASARTSIRPATIPGLTSLD